MPLQKKSSSWYMTYANKHQCQTWLDPWWCKPQMQWTCWSVGKECCTLSSREWQSDLPLPKNLHGSWKPKSKHSQFWTQQQTLHQLCSRQSDHCWQLCLWYVIKHFLLPIWKISLSPTHQASWRETNKEVLNKMLEQMPSSAKWMSQQSWFTMSHTLKFKGLPSLASGIGVGKSNEKMTARLKTKTMLLPQSFCFNSNHMLPWNLRLNGTATLIVQWKLCSPGWGWTTAPQINHNIMWQKEGLNIAMIVKLLQTDRLAPFSLELKTLSNIVCSTVQSTAHKENNYALNLWKYLIIHNFLLWPTYLHRTAKNANQRSQIASALQHFLKETKIHQVFLWDHKRQQSQLQQQQISQCTKQTNKYTKKKKKRKRKRKKKRKTTKQHKTTQNNTKQHSSTQFNNTVQHRKKNKEKKEKEKKNNKTTQTTTKNKKTKKKKKTVTRFDIYCLMPSLDFGLLEASGASCLVSVNWRIFLHDCWKLCLETARWLTKFDVHTWWAFDFCQIYAHPVLGFCSLINPPTSTSLSWPDDTGCPLFLLDLQWQRSLSRISSPFVDDFFVCFFKHFLSLIVFLEEHQLAKKYNQNSNSINHIFHQFTFPSIWTSSQNCFPQLFEQIYGFLSSLEFKKEKNGRQQMMRIHISKISRTIFVFPWHPWSNWNFMTHFFACQFLSSISPLFHVFPLLNFVKHENTVRLPTICPLFHDFKLDDLLTWFENGQSMTGIISETVPQNFWTSNITFLQQLTFPTQFSFLNNFVPLGWKIISSILSLFSLSPIRLFFGAQFSSFRIIKLTCIFEKKTTGTKKIRLVVFMCWTSSNTIFPSPMLLTLGQTTFPNM